MMFFQSLDRLRRAVERGAVRPGDEIHVDAALGAAADARWWAELEAAVARAGARLIVDARASGVCVIGAEEALDGCLPPGIALPRSRVGGEAGDA